MRRIVALLSVATFGGWAVAQVPKNARTAPKPILTTPAATPENTMYLDLSSGGKVAIQLRPDVAPAHVAQVKTLVRRGFYDNLAFHRVIDGFMAQGGDPKGTGEGGSDLPDLKAEFSPLPHVRGVVSMARAASPDSANSQFFIMFAPRMALDGKYTVIGRVIGGMGFVDAIKRGEGENGSVESEPTRIVKASLASDLGVAARPAAAALNAPVVAVPVPVQPTVPAPRAATVKAKPAPKR